jgi:hypothetical protein
LPWREYLGKPRRIELIDIKTAGDNIMLLKRFSHGLQPPSGNNIIGVAERQQFGLGSKSTNISCMCSAFAI